MSDNLADIKARAAAARAAATRDPTPHMVGHPADTPGCTAWSVGNPRGVMVLMPTLLPGAPASLRRRYRDRIVANATGRCPRCGETSGIDAAPAERVASGTLKHADNCPLLLDRPSDGQWIDQTGIRFLALASLQ
jgi:hypothetical protein